MSGSNESNGAYSPAFGTRSGSRQSLPLTRPGKGKGKGRGGKASRASGRSSGSSLSSNQDPQECLSQAIASEERGERYLTSSGRTAQLAYESALEQYRRVGQLLSDSTGKILQHLQQYLGQLEEHTAASSSHSLPNLSQDHLESLQLHSDAAYNSGRVLYILATQFSPLPDQLFNRLVEAGACYDSAAEINVALAQLRSVLSDDPAGESSSRPPWLDVGYNKGFAMQSLGDLISEIGAPLVNQQQQRASNAYQQAYEAFLREAHAQMRVLDSQRSVPTSDIEQSSPALHIPDAQEQDADQMDTQESADDQNEAPGEIYAYEASHVSLSTLVDAFESGLEALGNWEEALLDESATSILPEDREALAREVEQYIRRYYQEVVLPSASQGTWNADHPDYVPYLAERLDHFWPFDRQISAVEAEIPSLIEKLNMNHPDPRNAAAERVVQLKMDLCVEWRQRLEEAAKASIAAYQNVQAQEKQEISSTTSQGARIESIKKNREDQGEMICRLAEQLRDTASIAIKLVALMMRAIRSAPRANELATSYGHIQEAAWDFANMAAKIYTLVLQNYPDTSKAGTGSSSSVIFASSTASGSSDASHDAERRRLINEALAEITLFRMQPLLRDTHIFQKAGSTITAAEQPVYPFRDSTKMEACRVRKQLSGNARIYARKAMVAAGLGWALTFDPEAGTPAPVDVQNQDMQRYRRAGGQTASVWEGICNEADCILLCVRTLLRRLLLVREESDLGDIQDAAFNEEMHKLSQEFNALSYVAWMLCNRPVGPADRFLKREAYSQAFLHSTSAEGSNANGGRYVQALIAVNNLTQVMGKNELDFWAAWNRCLTDQTAWQPINVAPEPGGTHFKFFLDCY